MRAKIRKIAFAALIVCALCVLVPIVGNVIIEAPIIVAIAAILIYKLV